MRTSAGPWAVAAACLVLAACASDDPPTGPELLQARLSAEALRTLDGRTCDDLPERTQLTGLPDLSLACLGTGPERDVSAGDGRPTVMNLWASWCEPCVREMPLLQRTAERMGSGTRFVGVDTLDEPDSAAGLLSATGVRYDQFADPDGEVKKALRALGLPVTVVFDARGREVARRSGEIRGTWLDDALRRAGAIPTASARPTAPSTSG